MFVSEKQYPPQLGTYKVKVKQKTVNTVNDNNVLRLEISVGQPYHEGEKFKCTIDWAKDRFGKIIILVNDSLQRFNYMFDEGLSEKDAYSKALNDGTNWVARNMGVIATLPDFEIYRWDAWKRSEDYFSDLHKVRALYNTNADFKSAIDDAINQIWLRKKSNAEHREQEFIDLSRNYLIEETAILSVIYKTFKGISAYPGSFLEIWKMFLDKEVYGAPEGLRYAHCLRIDFQKR